MTLVAPSKYFTRPAPWSPSVTVTSPVGIAESRTAIVSVSSAVGVAPSWLTFVLPSVSATTTCGFFAE